MTQTNGHKTITGKPIELSLDLDTYTNGELEELEDITGVEVSAFPRNRLPSQKILNVLLWLTMRRDQPEITRDDVRALHGYQWTFAKTPDPLPDGGEPDAPPKSPTSARTTA